MFTEVDELEKVMHMLDGHSQMARFDEGINCDDDELKKLQDSVIGLIKKMDENIEILERMVQNCS